MWWQGSGLPAVMGAFGCQRQLSMPGAQQGADEASPRPARCWELAVLGACWLYFRLLSFFPAFLSPLSLSWVSQACREACSPAASVGSLITLGAHLPPLQWGRGNKGTGTAFCETPILFFHHFPSQPAWPWLVELVPPSPGWEKPWRTPRSPGAGKPRSSALCGGTQLMPCPGAVLFAPHHPFAGGC